MHMRECSAHPLNINVMNMSSYVKYIFAVIKCLLLKGDWENSEYFTPLNNTQYAVSCWILATINIVTRACNILSNKAYVVINYT